MATTTNYGWTTPDDTALVKDGASAIRTLGSSVDTTTKALNPSTTLGDIEYRSSTANTNTRLGIGSTGNVLTVAGGVPSWATPAAGGGLTLLQSLSLSGASTTSSTFTATDYVDYYIVVAGVYVSALSSAFQLRLNGDSGANYDRNTIQCNDSSISCDKSTGATNIFMANLSELTGVNEKGNGTIRISRINDTGQVYVESSILTTLSGGNGQRLTIGAGSYNNSAAITSITFLAPSFNFSGGTAYIYGVK